MGDQRIWRALAIGSGLVCGVSLGVLALTRCLTPTSRFCDLCGYLRLSGTLLSSGDEQRLWACSDCQRQLARHVDAGGVLGG